jgi:PAS domain S-box-containing protein/putative nucleotidyltransferase with HDIG domain
MKLEGIIPVLEESRSERMLLVLSKVSRALQNARSPEDVYVKFGEAIHEFGFDSTILTPDHSSTHLTISYQSREPIRIERFSKILGFPIAKAAVPIRKNGILDQVVNAGQTVFLESRTEIFLEVFPRRVRSLVKRLVADEGKDKRGIIVPLRFDEHSLAVMGVSGTDLKESDVPTITALAGQVSTALQNANAHVNLQEWRLEQFKRIYKDSDQGFGIGNLDGTIQHINTSLARIIGEEHPDSLIGLPFLQYYSPDSQEKMQREVLPCLMEKDQWEGELALIQPGGNPIPTWESFSLIRDEKGIPLFLVDVIRDDTERVIIKKALLQERESAQRLRDIAGVMFVGLNDRGEITLINRKACEILECEQEEAIGKIWFDSFLPERTRDQTRTVFSRILTGEIEPVEYFENPILTNTGEERIIAWHNTLVEDDKGSIVGTLSSGEDITDRQLAEAQLATEEQFIETALNAQLDTFFLFEPSTGKAIRWNRAFKDISGYTDDEIAKRKAPASYYGSEDLERAAAFLQEVMMDGAGSIELDHVCKDGRKIPTEYRVSVICDDQGDPKYMISIGRDISVRRRQDRVLKALIRAAQAMEASITVDAIFAAASNVLADLGFSCMYFPIDESGNRLKTQYLSFETRKLRAAEKLVGMRHEEFAISVDDVDIYRKVIREKKAFLVQDTEAVLRQALPHRHKKYAGSIVRMLGIPKSIPAPLISGNSVIGLISVMSDVLTEDDVPVITAFSHQMAAAVNKAGLMEKLERGLRDVELAKERSDESLAVVQKTLDGAVQALASMAEKRDPYTAGHQKRVTYLACAIAEEMGLPEEKIEGIRVAGFLHDLGKISVPVDILNKPGQLLDVEFELIKTHPNVGYDILKGIEFPWPIADIVVQHHERVDGSGYPAGLSGKDLLIEAKILAVADVVEAMSSHRPYRPALGIEAALEEITIMSGTHFDPGVVAACVKLIIEDRFDFGKSA